MGSAKANAVKHSEKCLLAPSGTCGKYFVLEYSVAVDSQLLSAEFQEGSQAQGSDGVGG